MKLQELLKSAYEYTLETPWENGDVEAVFTTDAGEKVEVYFSSRRSYGMFDVDFRRGGRYGLTGDGDALRIFATVLAVIDEFIETHAHKGLFFSATKTEGSRVSLYNRLVKRYTAGGRYVDVTRNLDRLKDEDTREWFAHKIEYDDRAELKLIVKKEELHEAD